MSRALNHHAGAYLIDDGRGAFPIFSSIANFGDYGMDNIDNYYIVLPLYKLLVYTSINHLDYVYTIDNTKGTTILYVSSPSTNGISSCKLFFNGVEIKS